MANFVSCFCLQVADSYVLDERVGFAEPTQGVELYFCPPHQRTREILGKVLPEEQIQALDSVDSGLIGVVIWRRTQFTSSAATEQQSASKKQHVTTSTSKSRHKQDRFDPSVTVPYQPSRYSSRARMPPSDNGSSGGVDDDDDVPPGFGPAPGASRDIDDLPEFTFSGAGSDPRAAQGHPRIGSRPSRAPSRPVDQIRELIHKYGQPGAEPSTGNPGVKVQPWNDDDDDIPEWQPDGVGQRFKSTVPHNLAGHQFSQVYPSTGQAAMSMGQHQQPASWSSSPRDQGGQLHGPPRGRATTWRQDGQRGGGY